MVCLINYKIMAFRHYPSKSLSSLFCSRNFSRFLSLFLSRILPFSRGLSTWLLYRCDYSNTKHNSLTVFRLLSGLCLSRVIHWLYTCHSLPGLGDPDSILERQRSREAQCGIFPQAQPHRASSVFKGSVSLFLPQLLQSRHRAHENSRLTNLLFVSTCIMSHSIIGTRKSVTESRIIVFSLSTALEYYRRLSDLRFCR